MSNSTQNDWAKAKMKLNALRELCIEEDLLDLQAYGDIERADKIQNAWDALKVIENIDTLLADARREERDRIWEKLGAIETKSMTRLYPGFRVTAEYIDKADVLATLRKEEKDKYWFITGKGLDEDDMKPED